MFNPEGKVNGYVMQIERDIQLERGNRDMTYDRYRNRQVDKNNFVIIQYHIKEEDKEILDKEMKRRCHWGIPKEDFQPSPVQ